MSLHRLALAPLLGAVVTLAGCTMLGPDFFRPDVSWLSGWKATPVDETVTHTNPDPDQWWRSFNDPVLDQLVAEAQRKNPGVRTAGLRIMEARAQLGVAGSSLYPQLQQFNAESIKAGQNKSPGSDTSFTTSAVGLTIGWEIDFWGKFRRAIESADAAYLASIAQYDDMQVLVAAQTASLYTTIRTLELRLRITHENAALQKRSLEITERLFKSGNESELDVQQAKTLYLSTIATIPDLEGTLRQTQNALSVLLARPPGPIPEMAAGAEKIPMPALEVIVDMPAEKLRRRPDVRTAEAQLVAQSALIGVREAALYPSISLLGTIGLSRSSLNSAPDVTTWGIGPTLVWNIFDWGRLKNQVLVEDARFQQLYEIYQDTVLKAAREVDDAAVSFAKNRAQIEILKDSTQAARRSLDIATIQYREGLVDFERVLDSQRSLFSQQERLVAAQGDVVKNLVALYKAMGGGWQAARAEPVLDEATRRTMNERSQWGGLLEAPLPAPGADQPQSATSKRHEPE